MHTDYEYNPHIKDVWVKRFQDLYSSSKKGLATYEPPLPTKGAMYYITNEFAVVPVTTEKPTSDYEVFTNNNIKLWNTGGATPLYNKDAVDVLNHKEPFMVLEAERGKQPYAEWAAPQGFGTHLFHTGGLVINDNSYVLNQSKRFTTEFDVNSVRLLELEHTQEAYSMGGLGETSFDTVFDKRNYYSQHKVETTGTFEVVDSLGDTTQIKQTWIEDNSNNHIPLPSQYYTPANAYKPPTPINLKVLTAKGRTGWITTYPTDIKKLEELQHQPNTP